MKRTSCFMPRRSRDNQGKFLPKIPTLSSTQPSLFFGDYEIPSLTIGDLEDPLGKQLEILEEPIGEEEEETIPLEKMATSRNVGSSPLSKDEFTNQLEDFKSDMRQFLAMQLDTL